MKMSLDEVFLDRLKTKVIHAEKIRVKRVAGGFRLLIPSTCRGVYIRFVTDEGIHELFKSFSPYKFNFEGEYHGA